VGEGKRRMPMIPSHTSPSLAPWVPRQPSGPGGAIRGEPQETAPGAALQPTLALLPARTQQLSNSKESTSHAFKTVPDEGEEEGVPSAGPRLAPGGRCQQQGRGGGEGHEGGVGWGRGRGGEYRGVDGQWGCGLLCSLQVHGRDTGERLRLRLKVKGGPAPQGQDGVHRWEAGAPRARP